MVADRPPSGPNRGRSTTVVAEPAGSATIYAATVTRATGTRATGTRATVTRATMTRATGDDDWYQHRRPEAASRCEFSWTRSWQRRRPAPERCLAGGTVLRPT